MLEHVNSKIQILKVQVQQQKNSSNTVQNKRLKRLMSDAGVKPAVPADFNH